MPTDAFYALDAAKKQHLVAAAKEEFASLPYDKVSMFKIAQNAGVSRSGLYYYFADKKDVYRYVTKQMFEPFLQRLRGLQRLDPFVLSRDFFVFFANCKHTESAALLKQMLWNMKSIDVETIITEHLHDEGRREEFDDIASLMDLSTLKPLTTDEAMGLLILLQTMSIRLLIAHMDDEISFDDGLAQLDRTFDLLRYGFVER